MFGVSTSRDRNDLSIYDRTEPWWDPKDPSLDPLRRLVPTRMAFADRFVQWPYSAVLDIGCGGGYVSTEMARRGARVTGVDLARKAIEAARRQAAHENLSIQYRVADAMRLPFADEMFDIVVCTDVLVHVPEPRKVLSEAVRVLRPGGHLLFSSIDRSLLAEFVMITLAEDLLRFVPAGTHDPAKFIRPSELIRWLQGQAMEPLQLRGIAPTGWWFGLRFGQMPWPLVMYQGCAKKPALGLGYEAE